MTRALGLPDVGPAFMAWVYIGVLAAFLICVLFGDR